MGREEEEEWMGLRGSVMVAVEPLVGKVRTRVPPEGEVSSV